MKIIIYVSLLLFVPIEHIIVAYQSGDFSYNLLRGGLYIIEFSGALFVISYVYGLLVHIVYKIIKRERKMLDDMINILCVLSIILLKTTSEWFAGFSI